MKIIRVQIGKFETVGFYHVKRILCEKVVALENNGVHLDQGIFLRMSAMVFISLYHEKRKQRSKNCSIEQTNGYKRRS